MEYFGILLILFSSSNAYLNIEQYCRAFDENFRPIICVLKNNANQTSGPIERPYPIYDPTIAPQYPILVPQKTKFFLKPKPKPRPPPRRRPRPPRPRPRPGPPPPPHHAIYLPDYGPGWGWEEEDECSCDLNCYPIVANTNTTGVSYRCRSCGSTCWVRSTSSSNVRCSCAVPSGNATCVCTATCATWRMSGGGGWSSDDSEESGEDANCIFTVSNLTDFNVGQEQRPYNCACCKSTEADGTSSPDFVCICQRTGAVDDDWRNGLGPGELTIQGGGEINSRVIKNIHKGGGKINSRVIKNIHKGGGLWEKLVEHIVGEKGSLTFSPQPVIGKGDESPG